MGSGIAPGVGLDKLQQEWLGRLPESLRGVALPEVELRGLLQAAARVLREPTPSVLSQVEATARIISRRLVNVATVEVLLRVLRDELVRILTRHVPYDQRAPTALGQLISRL